MSDSPGLLSILYRGPLSSCNYGCEYCPFAKREESRAELEARGLAIRDVEAGSPSGARGVLRLTPAGFARADAIGPWLGSALVRRRMADYELT